MKKRILAFLTAAMCFAGVMPVNAIAETADVISQETEKKASLIVTVYNEDEGGLYTDELDITICGSSNVNIGSQMDGTIMLCGFDTSESNPFVLEDFEIHQDYRYNVIDISSNNFDGYDYVMDYDRFDKELVFTDATDQKYDIYMKKSYFIVHSDTSLSTDKYGEENIKNINEVDWLLRDLINSDTFKVRDMAKRQYLAKSMLMSLCEFKMIADWSFDEAENVMSFTYNCGITGQLRPEIFEDEHKQLENVKLEDAAAVVRATIIGIRDHEVIIKPVSGSWESWAVGSKLALSTGDFNNSNITPTLGMKLEITYNKGFLENSPAEFENVLKIKVLSEDAGLIKSDANCDEDVDMSDVVLIMQALANPNKYGESGTTLNHITGLGKLNGDVNGDGLTVGDAQAIQKNLLGISDSEEMTVKLNTIIPQSGTEYVELKPNEPMISSYDVSLSSLNGVGVWFEFNSTSYPVTVSTENGKFKTFTYKSGGIGFINDVGSSYNVGQNGSISFVPETVSLPEDYKAEVKITGDDNGKNIDLGTLIIKMSEKNTDGLLTVTLKKPDSVSAVVGKKFVFEKEGFGGDFWITFNKDGSFLYSTGDLSSYIGGGTWEIKDDTVVMTENTSDKVQHLKIQGNDLIYIADKSDSFYGFKVNDGEKFTESEKSE